MPMFEVTIDWVMPDTRIVEASSAKEAANKVMSLPLPDGDTSKRSAEISHVVELED